MVYNIDSISTTSCHLQLRIDSGLFDKKMSRFDMKLTFETNLTFLYVNWRAIAWHNRSNYQINELISNLILNLLQRDFPTGIPRYRWLSTVLVW